MKRLLSVLLLLAASTAGAQTQVTIRVCTYNMLNFGGSVDATRTAAIQTVIRAVQPDILVAHEIVGSPGFDGVGVQVSNAVAPRFLRGVFTDGPDRDNAVFYDTAKVTIVDGAGGPIHTRLRDINEWVFIVKETSDTIHVFGCHLKAGDTNVYQRTEEATLIRQRTDALTLTHHFILAGDLNTYTSTEGAYEALTYLSRTLPGHFVDPIDSPGKWHSDSTFAFLHTRSTRVRQFGGGVGGGLDDRFDFILISQELANTHSIPASYTAFGNDKRHFNDSINALPNSAVPDSIAQALYDANDHLPVFLDLEFPGSWLGVEDERGKVGPMDLTEERKR